MDISARLWLCCTLVLCFVSSKERWPIHTCLGAAPLTAVLGWQHIICNLSLGRNNYSLSPSGQLTGSSEYTLFHVIEDQSGQDHFHNALSMSCGWSGTRTVISITSTSFSEEKKKKKKAVFYKIQFTSSALFKIRTKLFFLRVWKFCSLLGAKYRSVLLISASLSTQNIRERPAMARLSQLPSYKNWKISDLVVV